LDPIADDLDVSANDLLKGIDHSAHVMVANILADIIVLMIEDACRLLKQDGTYIISEIIEDKKAMVLEALTKVGFVVDQL
ncbi:50S ribosomal protein L11 methyltransferase, partial [Enterococcus faecalis]|uniref:50S ribosomal protein L11 methyltransferase n=1 Tax=Enterococcus faecalis TaxID=1351 RepID=UPI003D6B2FF0